MKHEFTRAECQLLALLKILKDTGLTTENELKDMAMEFIVLRLAVNNRDVEDAIKVLDSGGTPTDVGLDAEDHKWFTALNALANPEEMMEKLGHVSMEELKASLKSH